MILPGVRGPARGPHPAPVADWRRLSRREKMSLTKEVLTGYVIARRGMRTNQLLVAAELSRQAHIRPVGYVPAAERTQAARKLARSVTRVLRLLPTDTRCLAQSLTLSRCLSSRGIDSVLVVGVQVDPEFAAHAWVELDGVPLLPPGTEQMERLIEI